MKKDATADSVRPDVPDPDDTARAAILAFGALAQETRLAVFRLLMRAVPEGLAAGEIAARVAVPPATLSFHLRHLEQAGLVSRRRESRHVVYAADLDGARALVRFLTRDCCGGRPEICAVVDAALDCAATSGRAAKG